MCNEAAAIILSAAVLWLVALGGWAAWVAYRGDRVKPEEDLEKKHSEGPRRKFKQESLHARLTALERFVHALPPQGPNAYFASARVEVRDPAVAFWGDYVGATLLSTVNSATGAAEPVRVCVRVAPGERAPAVVAYKGRLYALKVEGRGVAYRYEDLVATEAREVPSGR